MHPSVLLQPDLIEELINVNHCQTKNPRTESVPEFGGFRFPFVIACQIGSPGIASSVQTTVKRGASHRTIDDGSSNRINRFSRLHRKSSIDYKT